MPTEITEITKGRVVLIDGRRIDFESAEVHPANRWPDFPAHLRIAYRDGSVRHLFWTAIAEIVEDRAAACEGQEPHRD